MITVNQLKEYSQRVNKEVHLDKEYSQNDRVDFITNRKKKSEMIPVGIQVGMKVRSNFIWFDVLFKDVEQLEKNPTSIDELDGNLELLFSNFYSPITGESVRDFDRAYNFQKRVRNEK